MNRIELCKTVEFEKFVNVVRKKGEFVWADNNKVKFFTKQGKWLYKDFLSNDGGTNINFLMNYYNMEFKEAVNHILRSIGMEDYDLHDKRIYAKNQRSKKNVKVPKKDYDKKIKEIEKKVQEKIKEENEGKIRDWNEYINNVRIDNNFGSYRYLVNIRRIDRDIFLWLYNNNYLFRGEREGYKYDKNLQDKSVKADNTLTYFNYKNPLTGKIEGITSRENRDLNKFLGKDCFARNYGGSKWGFGINKQKQNITHIKVFEAPIDLISYICLNRGTDKLDAYLVAMGGSNFKIIDNAIKELGTVQKITVCSDNDEFGKTKVELEDTNFTNFGKKVFEHFRDNYEELQVVREVPQGGKDWNDILKNKKG